MPDVPEMELHRGSEDWSALYVSGTLDRVGSHYLADERIQELAGVRLVVSDDFLRGGNERKDVARTLDEVREYREAREAREAHAARLEQQAQDLLARAKELRGV
jgi:hypothetical protein